MIDGGRLGGVPESGFVRRVHYPGQVIDFDGDFAEDHSGIGNDATDVISGVAEVFPGLYESLHTSDLAARLTAVPNLLPEYVDVEDDVAAQVLARHLGDLAERRLSKAKAADRVALANQMLTAITAADSFDSARALGELIEPGPRELMSLSESGVLRNRDLRRPTTRLSEAALYTNAREDPNLAGEIRRELDSADRVDLLCAFIRWSGLRLLDRELKELCERGVKLRVITSTYMGATERKAIDHLVNRYGAEVKINYETQSTRLHAKAWMFTRSSGFDTAYVGSSNLSQAAMLDGLEWNVRLSSVGTPDLLRKFQVTFDSYWEQRAFQSYDPARDAEQLDEALARSGGRRVTVDETADTGLELQPHLYQREMLEDLESTRVVHGHHRNLLVAATGTGKTVIAALDYKRLCEAAGCDLSLLFVAHRQEILKQSLTTYRTVMQSGSFGELYVGTDKPRQWRHVFASVQSLAQLGLSEIEQHHFDVVVIDEFHHAAARTYRDIIDHLKPRELLGLTATPERGDGVSVADAFFDGRIASELRLWDALDNDLLVPFHYFGVADDVDLSQVEWKRGNYDVVQLSNLYTGNDARAAKVIRELRDKVLSTGEMRALGFCVSVKHAEYMAKVFNEAGIESVAVSGGTPDEERAAALTRLRSREINCIFTVDLFNEGLDLPEIDTIMLLRPTQSSTIFLQQLGRGLRRAEGKSVLTVLDLIGQQRREFRFDPKFRALTGLNRKPLEKAIEDEFPQLPSGSQVSLDRVAQKIVLDSIKTQLKLTRRRLVAEVKSVGEQRLQDFLRESGRELRNVYRKTGDSWSTLIYDAGLGFAAELADDAAPTLRKMSIAEVKAEELLLLKRVGQFICVDDGERAETYSRLLTPGCPAYGELSSREQIFAAMLTFAVWPDAADFRTYDEALRHLRSFPRVCAEIEDLLKLVLERARPTPRSLGMGLQHIPLKSHATYRREEALAALGYLSIDGNRASHREGVAWCKDERTDAFFVTVEKDAKERAASIMYKDYAISQDLFHWESQNATTPESKVGRRYLGHKEMETNIVLFTRQEAKDDLGMTAPFTCLGTVDYVQHSGSKPVSFVWKLRRPMPADVFAHAAAVAQ
ncbi:DUF3427 domain-containing protein [Specibacter cremeus]|uniref:DUF3427 domain-containing protein n=1 Tax=Specibacter cremeus TaxID=1629051 RepID=UPI000F7B6BFB|nr:DEAD/DEAH box helicase [Specibacter cremeus]